MANQTQLDHLMATVVVLDREILKFEEVNQKPPKFLRLARQWRELPKKQRPRPHVGQKRQQQQQQQMQQQQQQQQQQQIDLEKLVQLENQAREIGAIAEKLVQVENEVKEIAAIDAASEDCDTFSVGRDYHIIYQYLNAVIRHFGQ